MDRKTGKSKEGRKRKIQEGGGGNERMRIREKKDQKKKQITN